ncbi:MAG: Lrp/AsnC family transcriptional regulator [Nanoarchaeota archaeon]|nr:Lrp/AsnC family transcriptional regulator [Nanoarchaeota archaeon]
MPIKIDLKDKRILNELDLDARQPISSIAKKVKLSKQLVGYRIKQLEKKGIIEGYYAVINISKLGYLFHRAFFRFQNTSKDKEEEIINYLKSLPDVAWIVTIDGRWDLAILTWERNAWEFNNLLEKLLVKYGQYLTDKYITIVTAIYHFKHKYLFDKKDLSEALVGGDLEDNKLDKIDFELIKILAVDGRMSLLELSKKLNISSKVVVYRMKRLIKKGIIDAFRAKINPNLLGYQHYKVFLSLKNIREDTDSKLLEFFRKHPNIIYSTKAVGEYDIEFELQAKSNEEFHNILREVKFNFSDVIKNYESFLIFYENQINYLPGYID